MSQRYDECAGINFQEGLDSLAVFSKYVNALFVDKSNPCFKMLLAEGCDVTAHNADRSYESTADGARWYLAASIHGVRVCLLIDTGAEVTVLSRNVYKCFSCTVDKSMTGVRPVKTLPGVLCVYMVKC